MVRIRRHGHFIDFSTCGNEGIDGRFPIQPQSRVAGRHQRGIHGSHERVHAHVANLVVLVQGAERLSQKCGIELTAVLALEGDGAPQKRRAQKSGDPLRAMIGERVEPDFTPGFPIE